MKRNNNKGFTLAELLIVVAIIAVLVAIAIPVFTSQLEKSRESTDMANVRSAYATVVTQLLEDGSGHSATVPAQQKQVGWQTSGGGNLELMSEGGASNYSYSAKASGDYTVSVDTSGNVTVN